MVRFTDPAKADSQLVFRAFLELDLYHTKDLWWEHPTKKGLWEMCGHTGDFVKMSSLIKFNGSDFERYLLRSPLVKAAVVGGEGINIERRDEEMGEACCTLASYREAEWEDF